MGPLDMQRSWGRQGAYISTLSPSPRGLEEEAIDKSLRCSFHLGSIPAIRHKSGRAAGRPD